MCPLDPNKPRKATTKKKRYAVGPNYHGISIGGVHYETGDEVPLEHLRDRSRLMALVNTEQLVEMTDD